MSVPKQNEPETENPPEDIGGFQNIYFDTSLWGHLTDARDRDSLINLLKRRRQIARASVISVAEILLTHDVNKRESLSHTVRLLCGQEQVLEQPLNIARDAGNAFLRGKRPLLVESEAAKSFYNALLDPQNVSVQQVRRWKHGMDSKFERFIRKVKPPARDEVTNYLALEFLERDDFLEILGKFPTLQELGLSTDQMRELCRASDIWRALAAMLAYIIQLSVRHAPRKKRKNGICMRRPSGADTWQTVYLGLVAVFVTGDRWLLEAATEVSRLLRRPRCTMYSFDFLDGLRKFASGRPPSRGICSVCGIARGQSKGGHAVVRRAL